MIPFDLTTAEKNAAIACLERRLADAQAACNVASLAELEATTAALRIAFDAGPDDVSDADVALLIQHIEAVRLAGVEDVALVNLGFIEVLYP